MHRGAGLGTTLVNHFIDIGRSNGLRHLNCMLISDLEADAVRTLEGLGFQSYVMPGYGTDPDGNQHDMRSEEQLARLTSITPPMQNTRARA